MIATILPGSTNFHAVGYNERKVSKGVARLLEIQNFGALGTFDPETCAVEWMILSGAVSPSCYQQAVADMDNIRVEVWLLVYDLLGLIGSSNASLQFPNNELN